MLGNFSFYCGPADFSKLIFSKNYFRNTITGWVVTWFLLGYTDVRIHCTDILIECR